MLPLTIPESPIELSRRAADRHTRMLVAGPPRHQALITVSTFGSAAGAVAAAAVNALLAVALGVLAAVLLGVLVGDRRNSWRYAQAATPATGPEAPRVARDAAATRPRVVLPALPTPRPATGNGTQPATGSQTQAATSSRGQRIR